jgi:transcriptional regulator with XRE-family HTH domain
MDSEQPTTVDGPAVARWRELAGMTQQDLADRVGMSRSYISQIERGGHPICRPSLLAGLAEALGVTVPQMQVQRATSPDSAGVSAGQRIVTRWWEAPGMESSAPPQLTKAYEANRRAAAHRAATDPAKLAKAVRVVQTALALNLITLADLLPGGAGAGHAAPADPAPPQPG